MDIQSSVYDAVMAILGEYEPVEVEVTGIDREVVVIPDATGMGAYEIVEVPFSRIEQRPDWNWFLSAAIFVVMLYCFLRAVGGMLKCKI